MSRGKQEYLLDFWLTAIFERLEQDGSIDWEKEIPNIADMKLRYGKRKKMEFDGAEALANYLYKLNQSNKLERFFNTPLEIVRETKGKKK